MFSADHKLTICFSEQIDTKMYCHHEIIELHIQYMYNQYRCDYNNCSYGYSSNV